MRFCRAWCALVGLAALAGCSRQETLPCEPEARYSTARSAPPVQIPDDLSPPDESDAIRLPSDVGTGGSITAGECLEEPPPFFGDSRPFVTDDDDAEDDQSRRQRREARREARRDEPASGDEPDAAPPERADPPPAGDDRVIDN
jgi:uncharacterized lipoprotein